jgi:hypothetical protein
MRTIQIRLAEIIEALSKALDLTEGQPPGHCIRACYIGTHIGREIGMADSELQDLYYTLLLKDLGCSSNAARICQLYMADDLSNSSATSSSSTAASARCCASCSGHTGMQAGLAERFRGMVNICRPAARSPPT